MPGLDRAVRWAPIALAVSVVVWIQFGRLDRQSPGGDERVYVDAGLEYLRGDLSSNPEHPPLAKLLLGAWQIVFAEGVVSARVMTGMLVIGTGAAVWFMLRHALGSRMALLPAFVVVLADHAIGGERIDRVVTLEIFVAFFGAWGLAFALRWRRTQKRRWIVASGIALAAAALAKVTAVLLIPALLVLLLGKRSPPFRSSLQAVLVFACAGIACALAVLAPFGGLAAIERIAAFQLEHAGTGHVISIDGVSYVFSPWWASLRFALDGVGVVPAIGLVVGAAAALLHRAARSEVALLATATATTLIVLSTSSVALGHYFLGWIWMPTALAGTGLVGLVEDLRGAQRSPVSSLLAALAVVIAFSFVWSAAASVIRVAQTGPSEAEQAVDVLLEDAGEPLVLVPGYDGWRVQALDGVEVTTDPALEGIGAIVVGDDPRLALDPQLAALLADPDSCEGGLVAVEDWAVCDLGGELVQTPTGYAVMR